MLGALGLVAGLVLAGVFAAAGTAKLADRAGTRTAVAAFGVPERLAPLFSFVVPLAELTVAILLLPGPTRLAGGAGSLALLGLFSVAIALSLARGRAPECHCFGQLHSAPASWKTLVRNGLLGALAVTVLAAGLAGETTSAVGWLGELDTTQVLATGGSFVALAIVAAGGMAFLSLARAHGRVLLRLDAIERGLAKAGIELEDESAVPELGLAPGTTAPSFATADTTGASVSLADLLEPGLPLLLLFTSPSCGPCTALLPDVAAWQDEHSGRLTIAIANGGDREESLAEAQEHGLQDVLADPDLAVHEAYQAGGTPSAVLVASDGTIASYVAPGADWIKRLLDRALAGAGESEEQGLSVGSPAPELTVPGLDGAPVSLAGHGREETLVLFWNPGCGFCSSMRNELLIWERSKPMDAPRLLIVSSGDAASTRAEGFSSTVALDPDFRAGEAFGANGTPMAVLVDRERRIASPLAGGAEAVFALAGGRGRVDSGPDVPVAVRAGP